MTSIMKLADDYARSYMSFGEPAARAALQSAIEALQWEVERLQAGYLKIRVALGLDLHSTDNLLDVAQALKAKLTALEKQEPIARVMFNDRGLKTDNLLDCDLPVGTLLYAAPKALEPLTEAMRKDIAMQCAKLDWDDDYSASVGKVIDAAEAAHGIGGTPKALAPLTDCRIELVTAIHTLASHYENRLHRLDADDRKLAEGDIAHAIKIASKWSWNGITKGTK